MSVFKIEKTKDFTVMSNYHLRDKNLSLIALSYFKMNKNINNDNRVVPNNNPTSFKENNDLIKLKSHFNCISCVIIQTKL